MPTGSRNQSDPDGTNVLFVFRRRLPTGPVKLVRFLEMRLVGNPPRGFESLSLRIALSDKGYLPTFSKRTGRDGSLKRCLDPT